MEDSVEWRAFLMKVCGNELLNHHRSLNEWMGMEL